MNDRYTSPETSRLLADAGLDDCELTKRWVTDFDPTYVVDSMQSRYPKALDLTDCLHEIEKRGATWLVETDHDTYCATAVLNPKFFAVMGGPSAAEAAGLCLLALMDKEREAKP